MSIPAIRPRPVPAPVPLPATASSGTVVVRLTPESSRDDVPNHVAREAMREKAWDKLLAILISAVPDRRDLMLRASDVSWFTGTGVPGSLFRARVPRVGMVEFTDHAARQVAALAELRVEFVERLATRRSMLLPAMLAEEWGHRFDAAPHRWRLVNGVVHAVLSAETYTPIDDIPLVRSIEMGFRAAGLTPVRLIRDLARTRIEFAGHAVAGTRYRVGVVLGNSEVGAASATLYPALVRRGGFATRLRSEGGVGSRHTISDPSALVERMTDALPRLLDAAADAVRTWEAIRTKPLPAARWPVVRAALTEVLGTRAAREVVGAWVASEAPTPTNLYRFVAARVSAEDPWRQVETDGLLARLLDPRDGD